MLVLARKEGEKVRIGGDIELTVIEIRGETVRIGISAPRGVPIYRQELLDAVREENRAAAASALGEISAGHAALCRKPGDQ
jgi:carbon storage regulator